MVTSLIRGKQFIENEKENVSKQDCVLNAAKRLLAKIKKDYPRLPICIQGDALYAAEPLMKLCKKKCHWEYLFTQKSTRQKNWMKGSITRRMVYTVLNISTVKKCNEKPLSADTDFGYSDADLSGVESIYKGAKTDNKKYIFKATGKFSNNNSNGRRCILHFQIHNSVSRITRLF